MSNPQKARVFLAKVNLTYKGETRFASVYDDGTAVFDSGEQIMLNAAQIEKIKEKKRAYEAQAARIQAERAAQAARQSSPEPEGEEEFPYPREEETAYGALSGHRKPSWAKIAVATLVYLGIVGGTLCGSTYLLDNYSNKVSVAQISQPMAKDAQFTPDNLSRLSMSERVYEELNQLAPNGLVLWEDAQGVVGKYSAMDTVPGQYLTYDYISDTPTMENPWIQGLDGTAEIYTIPFDAAAYEQMLFPGSHVRMRAVVSVTDGNGKSTSETEVLSVSAAAARTRFQPKAEPPVVPQANVEPEDEPTVDALTEGESANGEQEEPAVREAEQMEVPVSLSNTEAVDQFGNVVIVDIISGTGRSLIHDVYAPLIRMTREERREYLTGIAESPNASSYYAQFVPASLVLALDDSQTEELIAVQNMSNTSITYTILPTSSSDGTDEQNSMYLKFVEAQRDVNEILGNAAAVQ